MNKNTNTVDYKFLSQTMQKYWKKTEMVVGLKSMADKGCH